MKDEALQAKFPEAYVIHQASGITLSNLIETNFKDITPWNFPLWMPFKIGIPALITGNPVLLKHASNVPQTAELIGQVFYDAGFDKGEFTTLFVDYE